MNVNTVLYYEPAVVILNIDIAPQITFEDIPELIACPIYGFGKDVLFL